MILHSCQSAHWIILGWQVATNDLRLISLLQTSWLQYISGYQSPVPPFYSEKLRTKENSPNFFLLSKKLPRCCQNILSRALSKEERSFASNPSQNCPPPAWRIAIKWPYQFQVSA
jgi:hypothetical protein